MRKILIPGLMLTVACTLGQESSQPETSAAIETSQGPGARSAVGLTDRAAAIDAASSYRRRWLGDTVRIDYCAAVEALGSKPENLEMLPVETRRLITPAAASACTPEGARDAYPHLMFIDSIGQTDTTLTLKALVIRGDNHRWEVFTIARDRMVVVEHRLYGFMNFVRGAPSASSR